MRKAIRGTRLHMVTNYLTNAVKMPIKAVHVH